MDPPQQEINYMDQSSILVINPTGRMRQVFTPFKVQAIRETIAFEVHSSLVVDAVIPHHQFRLLYRIGASWWQYDLFRVDISF